MPQACPVAYSGYWNGVHYHYAIHCDTGQPVSAADVRQHVCGYSCSSCLDPIQIPSGYTPKAGSRKKAGKKEAQAAPTELMELPSVTLQRRGLDDYVPPHGEGRRRGMFLPGPGCLLEDFDCAVVLPDGRRFRLLVFSFGASSAAGGQYTIRIGEELRATGEQRPETKAVYATRGEPGDGNCNCVICHEGRDYYALTVGPE